MKIITCKQCGANEFSEMNGYRVCKYCRTKYSIQTEDLPAGEKGISMENDIERLLRKCREEPRNARKYANLILDIDATNVEALKYL